MSEPNPSSITVRLSQDTLARLQALKVGRSQVTKKWASNQALVAEAIELLLRLEPRRAPAAAAPEEQPAQL